MTDIVERLRSFEANLDNEDTHKEWRLVRDAADEIEDAANEIERLRSFLEEILDTCRDRQDVVDGPDGQPQPDQWMSLANLIEEEGLKKGGRYGY